jgi:quinol monooxygenase YgiN
MVVAVRFRVEDHLAERFRSDLEAVRGELAAAAGCESAVVGRNADEPGLWLLTTTWSGPGAYRRALSPYTVRLNPAWQHAVDEPTAFEVVTEGTDLNVGGARSIG